MKFIYGEDFLSYLDRLSYRGFVGFCYDSTLQGVLTFIVCAAIAIFTIIGLTTVIKMIFHGTGHKSSDYERWEKSRRKAEKRTGSKL
ncbi:MAG: hypothetical protein VB086_09330 [Clostridiaceae bacterium]|nr:hypothetical protein [Clostridiaceae bacterium]